MTKPSNLMLIGGALFAAALIGGVYFATSTGASADKTAQPARLAATASAPTEVSSAEANAWAEARAANTASAYKIYLAAFPAGAFADQAQSKLTALEAEPAPAKAKAAEPVRVAAAAREPSRATIAARCRAYVDEKLSAPSKVGRIAGGAVGGCAVGALAGGDDGRNCVVGAIAGGATGAITAENRERRRMREVEYCIANGGPPRG